MCTYLHRGKIQNCFFSLPLISNPRSCLHPSIFFGGGGITQTLNSRPCAHPTSPCIHGGRDVQSYTLTTGVAALCVTNREGEDPLSNRSHLHRILLFLSNLVQPSASQIASFGDTDSTDADLLTRYYGKCTTFWWYTSPHITQESVNRDSNLKRKAVTTATSN